MLTSPHRRWLACDTSRMYLIGDVPTRAAGWWMSHMKPSIGGLAMVKPGARLGDIGHAIQSYAEAQRCSVCATSAQGWASVPRQSQHLHFGAEAKARS